jgi:hypothetical protein
MMVSRSPRLIAKPKPVVAVQRSGSADADEPEVIPKAPASQA